MKTLLALIILLEGFLQECLSLIIFNSPASIPKHGIVFRVETFVFSLHRALECSQCVAIRIVCNEMVALHRRQRLTELLHSLDNRRFKENTGWDTELALQDADLPSRMKRLHMCTFLGDEFLSEAPFSEVIFFKLIFSFLSLSCWYLFFAMTC